MRCNNNIATATQVMKHNAGRLSEVTDGSGRTRLYYENRDDFIQSVSFYDRNGRIKLGGPSPTYETLKKMFKNYKLCNKTIKWKSSYYLF